MGTEDDRSSKSDSRQKNERTMNEEMQYGGDGSLGDADQARLSGALQGHLGRQLRAVYSQLVHEPIPDKLSKLLTELTNSQKSDTNDRE